MRKIITKAIALLIAFSTATFAQEKGSFTDPRDKKKYKTVKIGEQVWMAENLNFNAKGSKCYGEDGKLMVYQELVTLPKAKIQAYCTQYGRLYDYETAMKACPTGWHLPFNAEWRKLFIFADSTYTEIRNTAGKHLKAKSGWKTSYDGKPANGTDTYGFSALPGGSGDGSMFNNVDTKGFWRSATTNFSIGIEEGDRVYEYPRTNNKTLFSVRCIQGDGEAEAKAEAEVKEIKAAKEKAEAEVKAETEAYVKANGGTFTDARDKKTYKTIKINGQVWLAENLNYEAESSICYDDRSVNCRQFGRLYNWETATKSCPAGWHLPKNTEWDKLYRSADGTNGTESPYNSKTAGKFLKADIYWGGYDNNTNKFGFSALPGGWGFEGSFKAISELGFWWSASEENKDNAYGRSMTNNEDALYTKIGKKSYYSVRCIKD